MSQSVLSPATVEYPSSDGKPMAENDAQRFAMLYMIGALKTFFAHREDVYVSGDLLIYYEEGNPRRSVAPDVLVVFGVEDRQRPTYKVWEEDKTPDFVLEVASPSTWKDDEGWKAELYERLGVREYWQYDPTGGQLGVRLKGRRLVAGACESQPVVESRDGTLILQSGTLGLDLRVKGREMYFLAEKARLTADYLRASFDIFRQGRLQYEALFAICSASHWENIILLGDSELVELACMALGRTEGVGVRAILDPRSTRERRAKIPIHASVAGALGEFPNRRVDALVGTHFELRVSECYDLDEIQDELGLDASRFLVPAFLQ